MTQTQENLRTTRERGGILRRLIPLLFVSTLAAVTYGVVWITNPSGQEAGRGPWRAIGAIDPRISRTGTAIVFSYQGAIWRIGREGGSMTRLTKGPGFDSEPVWSPDEKRIAYFDATSAELNLIDAESAEPLKLSGKIIGNGKLFFHPDGKRLLGNFRVNTAEPSSRHLAWLDLASGGFQHVLDPPQSARVFCLSDDGEQIAFASHQVVSGEQSGVNGPRADVFIVPASGGQPRKLTRFPSRIFDMSWSRGQLYFSTDVGGVHNDLWTLAVNQPDQARKMTSGQADEDRASLTTDGRWLVYTDNRENATALAVRDLSTGEERLLSVSRLDFGESTGTLRLSVVEKQTGRPLTARLSIQQEGRKYQAPPGSLYRLQGSLLHFYAAGHAQATVPAGKYTLRAFRGLEYRPLERQIELAPGQDLNVKLELDRWNDPASRSWYSGESHIHANYGYGHWYNTPETMRHQLEGEGLKVANFMVANSDGDGVFDREFFRGAPDPLSSSETVLYWNEEFRATLWGHMTLLNLKQLVEPIFTGFRDTTNPWDTPTNSDIADATHLQKGHVNFTHPAPSGSGDPFLGAYAAKSMPVDVALGKIDSLDINGGEATVLLWYRLLNCGFRLPASAGTDCFLNRIQSRLPGSDRAYVKIDNGFSYAEWIRNLRAGRSFVTNGPLLEFTVGGKFLGESIQLAAPGTVSVRASATWRSPLERVELVYNGGVVATGQFSADRLTATFEQAVKVDQSGWLCFRAYAQDQTLAHTSPIYLTVAGKPAASEKDAQYFLQWIDRLEAKLNQRSRIPSQALRAHVESQLGAAREVYRKMAAQDSGRGN
ncbi:MAG: CehA/McbA family metallohydrolase [Acidobacteria bacterium]|nr:CehA/McbA family metallohydrolase [Acidobacteriota bacterium]